MLHLLHRLPSKSVAEWRMLFVTMGLVAADFAAWILLNLAVALALALALQLLCLLPVLVTGAVGLTATGLARAKLSRPSRAPSTVG